jgi:hypothetical protein
MWVALSFIRTPLHLCIAECKVGSHNGVLLAVVGLQPNLSCAFVVEDQQLNCHAQDPGDRHIRFCRNLFQGGPILNGDIQADFLVFQAIQHASNISQVGHNVQRPR